MKELSIEEKAARYDKAIEKLRSLHDDYDTVSTLIDIKEELEQILSELKESEDDRIRKEIIKFIKVSKPEWENYGDYSSWIAWLEKQGDIDRRIQEEIEKQTKQLWKAEKQVEPKFKVDDYLVTDYCKGKVIALTDDAYLLDTEQGIPFSCEHNAHLWTIQDAKDGDVLYTSSTASNEIFIFKGLTIEGYVECYCSYDSEDKYCEGKYHFIGKPDFMMHPATKEQRDLLFKKMKEAGYEWDAEKKELTKIKQNSAWSEEDELMLTSIIQTLKLTNGAAQMKIDWLKLLKERVQPQSKYEWKQENTDALTDFENLMMHIGISFFGQHAGLDPNDTNAIKEQANILLGLVPKQEWSEEDEYVYNEILKRVADKKLYEHDLEYIYKWLKSLRPQNTWKPSDELKQLKKL